MLDLDVHELANNLARAPVSGRAPHSEQALRRLLLLARADLARELTEDAEPDQLIDRVAALASKLIPGARGCAIALSVRQGPMVVQAQTDPLGSQIVDAEVLAGQGPSFDVIGRHGTVRIDDTRTESRWTALTPRLARLGVFSLAVCDLPVTRQSRGVLMVFSHEAAIFDDVSELMLPVFASRASIALGYRYTLQNLTKAVGSHRLVGQAVGILMERHKISEHEAFEQLVQASQSTQVKLNVIAQRVVDTGEEACDVFP